MWLKSRVVPIILDSLPSKAAVVSAHTPNYHFERNSQTPVLDHALFESSDQFVHPDVCRAKTLLQGESELSERCKVQNIKSGITSHVNKGQISKYFQEKKNEKVHTLPPFHMHSPPWVIRFHNLCNRAQWDPWFKNCAVLHLLSLGTLGWI